MNKNIILDTNLLLLFVVGTTNRSYIRIHKRLRAYAESDFDLLVNIVKNASSVVVTPNTLTETSNLLGHISEPARTKVFETLGVIIKTTTEYYYESRRAADSNVFIRLGLADAALMGTCDSQISLITADLDLYLAALNNGHEALNFNHIRDFQNTG